MDVKKSRPLSEDEICGRLIVDENLRRTVIDFVDLLDKQGILEMFIVGDKLDELIAALNEKDILTGEFAQVEYCGAMLRRYYESHFLRQVARQVAAATVTTDEQIASATQLVIELWQTPKHCSDLFLATCDLGTRLRKVYAVAIDQYFRQKVEKGICVISRSEDTEKVTTYWEELTKEKNVIFKLLDEAIPLGIEVSEEAMKWANVKKKVFNRIDFSSAMELTDFETVYEVLFGMMPSTPSGKTKSQAQDEVSYAFKILVLKDCLSQIPSIKNQTGTKITSMVQKEAKEDSLRIMMRYIQAFFMFYREDAAIVRRRQKEQLAENMLKFDNRGKGYNIPN